MGELLGVFYEDFSENLPNFNGSTLYMVDPWHLTHIPVSFMAGKIEEITYNNPEQNTTEHKSVA